MVIVKDSFHVEVEMEQKMSPESKKMFEDYYECRVQFRFYLFSNEIYSRRLSEREQTYLLNENKYSQTIYSNKDIKYNEISISDYELAYYKMRYILRDVKLLINKLEDMSEGFDIYLANINDIHKLKRIISDHFFVLFTHSKKIMGRNFLKSKDLYRHSLLIAVYNLRAGDDILVKGEEFTIKSIQNQFLTVINPKTNTKKTLHFNTIKEYLHKK